MKVLGARSLAAALAATALLTLPPGARAQSPPSTVFLEALTWVEIQDRIDDGATTVIVATAGTEQKGPHMVMGEHKYVLEYTTDKIARALGNALVSPIITYVPEGDWGDEPTGHMRMPGTITMPEEWFVDLLLHTGRSHEASGFRDIVFLGDSGGNQSGMATAVETLNEEWAGTGARAHFIEDYYGKSGDDARRYITEELGIPAEEIGGHAGITDTSQMWFVNERHIREDELADRGGFEGSGSSGNPTLASPEIGRRILDIKIDNALAEIRASLSDR
ncbi:MAG: creatininase family protein [Gemmatimonadota bacterium]|nr:creatininase family protein [Gemmatimonadota bacterium]